ncbi:MAG: tripartite tricarboxylate transporter substrate binding protein [Betaproteobacteria bacterium]|nr:tripartite tricarboxylate transporter substrate binding protein [Betaproteobacteria bacterium]
MRSKTLILLALLVCARAFAQAGAYPDRPLRLVVPFTPGGNADIVARIVGQGLTEELKQTVVVENKPGANAAIGAEYVARAAPDGYLLLFAMAESHSLNPHLRKALAYDPLKDFASVGIIDRFAFSLVVNPKLPVGDLPGFIAYAKQHPGKLNFASWGNGSISQIAFEQIKQASGIDLVHVPFQGAAPAISAVAAGTVDAFVVPLSVARPQAANGRVKLLAVTSARREDAAPEVPTATEQGVQVVISGWHILAAPAGTPREIVERLNRALNAVTARAEVRDRLLKVGVQPATSSTEETQNMVKAEWQRWGEVARKAGIKPE